jgi:hypothetical protein
MSGTKAGTRRRTLFLVLVCLAGLAVLTLRSPAGAAPALSTNIEDYVLFAQDSLHFKGGNSGGGDILNGNVGVNHAGGQLSMCGGGSPHPVQMSSGTQIAGDYVTLGTPCKLGHLYYGGPGHLLGAGSPTVESTNVRAPWTNIVPDAALANPPAPKPCTGDLIVRDGSHAVVSSDQVYCSVRLGRNSSLTITLYNPNTKIPEPRKIWVTKNVQFGAGSQIRGLEALPGGLAKVSSEVRWYVNSVGVKSNDASVSFSQNTVFHGRMQVPNGMINLGNSTTLNGKFWAKNITSDFSVNVVGPTTTSTSTTTSTTFRF